MSGATPTAAHIRQFLLGYLGATGIGVPELAKQIEDFNSRRSVYAGCRPRKFPASRRPAVRIFSQYLRQICGSGPDRPNRVRRSLSRGRVFRPSHIRRSESCTIASGLP